MFFCKKSRFPKTADRVELIVAKLLAKVKTKDITLKKSVLLIPVENQVRELYAKLIG